jgi:acetyl-CoA acetyltransferase
MEPVAVVGVGMTGISREKKTDTFADLIYDATMAALEDAGMTIDQIDNVVTVSNDFFDGRTISSMAIQDACGSFDKNVSTVEGDGTFGAFYGLMRILAGSFGTTLVCAHHKGSESEMPLITNAMFDPIYERALGLDTVTSAALQARSYMDCYGPSEEQFAMVSVKNHGNAFSNPIAQLPLELTLPRGADKVARLLSHIRRRLGAHPRFGGARQEDHEESGLGQRGGSLQQLLPFRRPQALLHLRDSGRREEGICDGRDRRPDKGHRPY